MNYNYKEELIEAFKNGLLLLVKWGLLIAAVIYAFNFSLETRRAAINGEQAAILINEYMKKGYLPKLENGQIPDKIDKPQAKPE